MMHRHGPPDWCDANGPNWTSVKGKLRTIMPAGHDLADLSLEDLFQTIAGYYGDATNGANLDKLNEATNPAARAADQGGDTPFVLHRDDVVILRALAKAGTTQTQEALEGGMGFGKGGLSRKTIGMRLARLRGAGLTYRPNGPHGGDAITKAGLRALDQAGPHGVQ